MFVCGVDEQPADGGVGFGGGGVGEDVAGFLFVGLEEFQGFWREDAEALRAGFGDGDEAAAVIPAEVLPLQSAAFIEADPGGVDGLYDCFLYCPLFFVGAGFLEVFADGLQDQFVF